MDSWFVGNLYAIAPRSNPNRFTAKQLVFPAKTRAPWRRWRLCRATHRNAIRGGARQRIRVIDFSGQHVQSWSRSSQHGDGLECWDRGSRVGIQLAGFCPEGDTSLPLVLKPPDPGNNTTTLYSLDALASISDTSHFTYYLI